MIVPEPRAASGAIRSFDGVIGERFLFSYFPSGDSSDSGMTVVCCITAQYSTPIRDRAGNQRNAGVSNHRPRSIISRRVSGKGETPNSMPRVAFMLLHGGLDWLKFSSQIPIHGKAARGQT